MNAKKSTGGGVGLLWLNAIMGAVLLSASSVSGAVANVTVANNVFRPASVTINAGDQVTWTWPGADGATPHSTTSDTPGLWDSGIQTQPFQFTMNFPNAGSFPYHCTVHAAIGMVGTVTVKAAGNAAPTITTQPSSQSVAAGANVSFTVMATGTAPLSFQWRKNGADIPGATGATLALNSVAAGDAGDYSVVVSNSAGSVTSAAARLTVNTAAAGPVITTQPTSQTVSVGADVTFTVVATGTAPLHYQWRFNGTDIAGAADSSLVLKSVQANEAGNYTVVVSDAVGSATSSAAVLTVQSGGGTVTFVQGNYNGLFSDPSGVTQQSSGSFSLATTAKGKFTGNLQNGGARLPLSGQFDSSGKAEKTISRRGQSALDVVLQLDPNDPDKLTGTVSDGTFTANLAGDRAVFDGRRNLAPQAGRYTISIAGSSDSASMPGGDSFGTIIVDKAGRVRLTGSLADGTRISQAVPISKNGDWPLYVPLYAGKGSIISWITFASTDTDDLGGDVVWIKPAVRPARLYPDGFAFSTKARGSRYQPGSGGRVLSFTDGELALGGGDLGAGISDAITIDNRNRVTNMGSNKLTLTFVPGTGLFSGRVMNPATSKFVSFSGVVLRKENMALGWFQGNRQTGEVVLSGR